MSDGDETLDVAAILGPKKETEDKSEGYEAEALASDLMAALQAKKAKDVVKSLKALISACGGK